MAASVLLSACSGGAEEYCWEGNRGIYRVVLGGDELTFTPPAGGSMTYPVEQDESGRMFASKGGILEPIVPRNDGSFGYDGRTYTPC